MAGPHPYGQQHAKLLLEADAAPASQHLFSPVVLINKKIPKPTIVKSNLAKSREAPQGFLLQTTFHFKSAYQTLLLQKEQCPPADLPPNPKVT